MARPIDAGVLGKALSEWCSREFEYFKATYGATPKVVSDTLRKVINMIADQPTIDCAPKWISVKDRLPENEETVLISAVRKCASKHWNVVMTAFYTDGKLHTEDSSFAWDSECVEMEYCEETDDYIIPEGWWEAVECGDEFSAVGLFVTHWMPLPEAPKEEEE